MEAAHHCQDWGGKLLTSARSCTGEPFRLYVSLILIRSCCWNFVRVTVFIRWKSTRLCKSAQVCFSEDDHFFEKNEPTFCGLRTLMTCVTVPWLRAGTTLLLGERSCSWNVWQTETVFKLCTNTVLGQMNLWSLPLELQPEKQSLSCRLLSSWKRGWWWLRCWDWD